MHALNRRGFFSGALAMAAGLAANLGRSAAQQGGQAAGVPDWLPQLDPALVQETVAESHRNLDRVRQLVTRHPPLANAAVDWGFGDWESALGAASHVGRRDIAEVLLASGARPTIFSAAMLGHLDVVKASVAASPGIQRTLGPHGITMLAHARAGGPAAAAVAAYLEALGDADHRITTTALDTADRDAVPGQYTFGTGPRDRFVVDLQREQLGILRPGGSRRNLLHVGHLVFFPSGVPSVRIAFARTNNQVTQLTIGDPGVFLTARRN